MPDNDLNINYEAVLEDLRAKRDRLDAAIRGIETILGLQSSGVALPVASGPSAPASQEVEPDSFFGMSIPDAIRKYLGMKKKPQSTQEIANALDRGGLTHQSENFGNTVGSILHRIDNSGGDIVRVGRGTWGLATWYPGARRKRPNGGKSEPQKDESDTPPTELGI